MFFLLDLIPTTTTVTAKNVSRALLVAGSSGLFLSFSAAHCTYCSVHEGEYSKYAALISSSQRPQLVRIDAERERALTRRYDIDTLPALVLAWSTHWTVYTGLHQHAAMAAFSDAQSAPLVETITSVARLEALLEEHRPDPWLAMEKAVVGSILLLGFFTDFDEQAEELEDLSHAAMQLRQQRTDVPVRAAAVTATPTVIAEYGRRLRWFTRSPCALLLVDGEVRSGEFPLDEQDEGGLDLASWAARAAVPALGELTAANFAAYAATNLPMLMAFIHPAKDNSALKHELQSVTTFVSTSSGAHNPR
jgi:hypothetical protein